MNFALTSCTSCLSPKILHEHGLQFLLGHEDVPREIEKNSYAKFGGRGGGE